MRTVIIGNSGSGKTWLAERLASASGAPIIHLDEVYWQEGGFDVARPEREVAALINSAVRGMSWIVEGVFGDLASRFLAQADVLLWLNTPWAECKRRLEERGSQSKAHMNREQSERGLQELLVWASAYYTRKGHCSYVGHLAIYESFLRLKHCLGNEAEVERYANAD
jgi:adenylate kinase family enzyme